jgi:hypothetical protein
LAKKALAPTKLEETGSFTSLSCVDFAEPRTLIVAAPAVAFASNMMVSIACRIASLEELKGEDVAEAVLKEVT